MHLLHIIISCLSLISTINSGALTRNHFTMYLIIIHKICRTILYTSKISLNLPSTGKSGIVCDTFFAINICLTAEQLETLVSTSSLESTLSDRARAISCAKHRTHLGENIVHGHGDTAQHCQLSQIRHRHETTRARAERRLTDRHNNTRDSGVHRLN